MLPVGHAEAEAASTAWNCSTHAWQGKEQAEGWEQIPVCGAPVQEQLTETLGRSCTVPVTFPGGKGQQEFSRAASQVKWAKPKQAKPYLHPAPKKGQD